MSALSLDDSRDPRSHRYYAPRGRVLAAKEATLQPVLERLRGSTRDYSADERLGGDADPASLPVPEFVVLPDRRFPFAALAAFAGGATAVAALAVAYIALGPNGVPAAAAAPSAPPVAQAPAAPAKIDARLAPNQPVSHVQTLQVQSASADAAAAPPVDTSKGDRLDAPADPAGATAYDPLHSPLSLWGLPPTQAAIEGAGPALAAAGAPPAPPAIDVAAAPPQQAAPEQPAKPVQHHAARTRHHVHHVRHVRHHRRTTTGAAAGTAGGQNANGAAAAQPSASKKFLGLFGG